MSNRTPRPGAVPPSPVSARLARPRRPCVDIPVPVPGGGMIQFDGPWPGIGPLEQLHQKTRTVIGIGRRIESPFHVGKRIRMIGQADLHAAYVDRLRDVRTLGNGCGDGLRLAVKEVALAVSVDGPGPRVECAGSLIAAATFHPRDRRQQTRRYPVRTLGGSDCLAAQLTVGRWGRRTWYPPGPATAPRGSAGHGSCASSCTRFTGQK